MPHLSPRYFRGPHLCLFAVCLFASLLPRTASAVEVTIPLNIDYLTLGAALKDQLYNGANGRAELWAGYDKCQFLYATNPRFGRNDGVLKLETNAELSLGLAVAGKCIAPITWSGIIEVESQPYVGADLAIKFHVTNINLYNSEHKRTILLRGFDLIKKSLIPRLETFSFDLSAPLRQLEDLVRAAAAPDDAGRVDNALSTLRPMSAVVPEDSGLKLTLELSVPAIAIPTPAASAAPLSPAEIAAWQAMLDNWDAFSVFAIKQLGGTVEDKQVRSELFDLLLDSRYRLVAALARPEASSGPDPIRVIFIDEWTRLRTIIQSAAQRGMLGNRALEFLSFASAGDALFAIDQAAPALGMRISEDDLRRLARIMAPQYQADPIAFSYDTDLALQQMFGVTEPLETLGPLEAPSSATGPTPGSSGTPGILPTPSPVISGPGVPTSSPTPKSSATAIPGAASSPAAMLRIQEWLFVTADADAAEDPLAAQIVSLGAVLRRVVVEGDNASSYTRSVENLLTLTAQRELVDKGLEPRYRQNYLIVVKSTAWQESCWRQFVRVHGRVRFLESPTADVGLMQVNKHVWRGFYSIPRLEWDIVYNAGAGAEILMRLMTSVAADASSERGDPLAEVARSTYAAYNGGPDAHNRWRLADEPAQARDIDQSFLVKFRAIAARQQFDIMTCAANWDRTHQQ